MEFSKANSFTARQIKFEGAGFKIEIAKCFEGAQTAWNKFLIPTINATAPVIGMALAAEVKNPVVGQATTNTLKFLSGGRILNLTDMHINGLRLKVL